jgi:hypothetical protein
MDAAQSPIYVPGELGTDYLLWQRGTALVAQAINRETLKLTGPVSILADPVDSGAIEGQIYVTASKQGPLIYSAIPHLTQFTWFDRTGRRVGSIGTPGNYHFGPFRISPDGHTIAASIDQPGETQMELLEIARGVLTGLPRAGNNSFPAWAPDSLALAYSNVIFHLSNSTASQGPSSPWDWSPDGRHLLHRRLVDYRNEIVVQDMTPDHTPVGEPRICTDGLSARFSPDGHWVAFSSSESGDEEVYVAPFSSPQQKVRISTSGGNFPAWSPEGSEIYYVQPGHKLMSVSVKIAGNSMKPASPQQLFVLPVSDTPAYPFDVAKDGRFLVRADVPPSSQFLTAIVNWQALIK